MNIFCLVACAGHTGWRKAGSVSASSCLFNFLVFSSTRFSLGVGGLNCPFPGSLSSKLNFCIWDGFPVSEGT